MVSDFGLSLLREMGFRCTVRRLALGAIVLAAAVSAVGADGKENAARRNYLTFEVGYVGSATSTKGDKLFPSETTVEFADKFRGTIEVRPASSPDGVTWYPVGDAVQIDGSVSEKSITRATLTGEGAVRATEISRQSYEGYISCAANLVNAFVTIRPEERRYDIQFTLMPDMASTMEAVLETKTREISGAPSLGGGRPIKPTQPQRVPLQMGPGQMSLPLDNYMMVAEVKGAALDADAAVLSGFQRIPVPKPAGWNGSWGLALQVKWTIDLSLPPVELVVEIDGYARWRPEGSIKEPKKPGNNLIARATLKPKTGPSGYVPEVKNIRFQLLDTSREPGICLNWPLNAKDDDYDLRLASVSGGVLDKSEQRLEVSDPRRDDGGQPYAEAQIDSYDFGGRASLRAICTLADGREIVGLMKGEGGGEDLVRLPKMAKPGWIAESWRKEKGVPDLADDDDDEKVEGQPDNGDGFTLYEEYRGWVVEGKRVEGDPAKKDFFVLNLIGVDARRGLELFEQVSALRVHSKLRRTEMSQVTRLMNGNHREAPHRVNQHGVWIKTFTLEGLGDKGAATPLTKAGVAGRPGITKGVGILARSNKESVFNQPYNLPTKDTIFAYDRAIAHELLHSVGVEHHGDGDETLSVWWVSTNHPRNKVGRPYFRGMNNFSGRPDDVYTLLNEKGEDLAKKFMESYASERKVTEDFYGERIKAEAADYVKNYVVGVDNPRFKTAEEYYNNELEDNITHMFLGELVGMPQGEHSGAQDCLMRYYFATFYPAKGKTDTYYQVTPGTERIGMELCRSGRGTGLNASSHKPQSRYFDAAGGGGNCFKQICPNDAVPPRSVK